MYDKQKINELFIKYCETGKDEVLEKLIKGCGGLMGAIILTRYPQFKGYMDDLRQDVCIKMIERFRDTQKRENLKRQYENPVVFLYSWLWNCIFRAMRRYSKMMSAPLPLTDFEEQIINFHVREKLSFEQISEQLGVPGEVVEGCYHIGRAKMHSSVFSGDDFESLLDRSSGDLINPSKQYELKTLKKEFKEKIKNMADRSPIYSKNKELKDKFIEEVTGMFLEEVGGEDENG